MLVVLSQIHHQQARFLLALTLFAGFSGSQVTAQPVNDLFVHRTAITSTNFLVTGNNLGATMENGEPNHANVTGGASVWWSWTAPAVGSATVSTAGSTFDTLLGVYVGTSVSSLTRIASNDDAPDTGDFTSQVTFDVLAGKTYQIAVDGFHGAEGQVTLSLLLGPEEVHPAAPAWTLPDLHGGTDSSSHYAGKVILLNFWATWCSPCKAEMPDLVELQQQYGADGLVVVGADVSWSQESAATVLNFLATWTPAVNYPMVMSSAATESAYGGIAAIPTTFVIDRQNRIRKQFIGSQSAATFTEQILPLLYDHTCLACRRDGNQLTVTWPTNAAAFVLETTTNVNQAVWNTWPEPPTVLQGSNTVVIPPTGGPVYFRLRLAD